MERLSSALPAALASFVGREAEIRDVVALLDSGAARLVTLTGPGGIGKTRLATEVARCLERDFADGLRYLSLASLRHPELILPELAKRLGVQERDGRPLLDLLVIQLRDQHLLLVLDNFEHLLDAAPVWLLDLLGACPRLKVLVTSRVILNISGEHRYLVPTLPVPESGAVLEVAESTAVRLFVQRAGAVHPGFALVDTNIESVREICRQLDGLPLAIELAAARVRELTPEQMLPQLSDRLQLLTGERGNAPRRSRSMRDAVGWSYDLLPPEERRMFRQLSVFVDGFTLTAAEAMEDTPELDAMAGVTSLVDKSLLRMIDDGADEPRYHMLETIREYGLERLVDSGEEHTARDRQADWCLSLASGATHLDPAGQQAWFDRLEAEHGNLRAAIAWLDTTGRLDELATLLTQIRSLWYHTGPNHAEGLKWFERVLSRNPDMPGTVRGDTLLWAGHLAQSLGRADANVYLERALSLIEASGDIRRQAETTEMLAVLAEDRGDYADAEARLLSARDLYRQTPDARIPPMIDYHLGVVAYGKGDLSRAVTMLEAATAAADAVSDQLIPLWSRNYLALIACQHGSVEHAITLLRRRPEDVAVPHRHDWVIFVNTVGVVASASGTYAIAARLFGAAARHDTPMMLPERAAFDRAAALARRHLGNESYEAAWEMGRHMRSEHIEAEIDQLLTITEQTVPPRPASQFITDLTPRELEVLRLLTDGLSNQEIAERLSITKKTAAHHVASILGKLDVDTRTAAVGYAIRHALA